MQIPNMTGAILDNLRPVRSDVAGQTSPPQNECMQSLANMRETSWLWDLDVNMIHGKQNGGNWDWRLLMHQLAQVCIHEPGDTSMQLPLQLRNRRRIWRILEQARVGDVAHQWSENVISCGRTL